MFLSRDINFHLQRVLLAQIADHDLNLVHCHEYYIECNTRSMEYPYMKHILEQVTY
jgi:hypothetical protein